MKKQIFKTIKNLCLLLLLATCFNATELCTSTNMPDKIFTESSFSSHIQNLHTTMGNVQNYTRQLGKVAYLPWYADRLHKQQIKKIFETFNSNIGALQKTVSTLTNSYKNPTSIKSFIAELMNVKESTIESLNNLNTFKSLYNKTSIGDAKRRKRYSNYLSTYITEMQKTCQTLFTMIIENITQSTTEKLPQALFGTNQSAEITTSQSNAGQESQDQAILIEEDLEQDTQLEEPEEVTAEETNEFTVL